MTTIFTITVIHDDGKQATYEQKAQSERLALASLKTSVAPFFCYTLGEKDAFSQIGYVSSYS